MQQDNRFAYEDEDSISLLTSLLVRYPELCTINFIPKGNLLKFSFIIKDEIDNKTLKIFSEDLKDCIHTLMYFDNKDKVNPKQLKINKKYETGYTVVEITRDTATLTQKELALTVSLIKDRFESIVVSDIYNTNEDYLLEQEDYIRYMLENMKFHKKRNKLIAVREEGRVLVFKR